MEGNEIDAEYIDMLEKTEYFYESCKNGDIDEIKIYYLKINSQDIIRVNYKNAFEDICISGNLDAIIWFIEIIKENRLDIDIINNILLIFRKSCAEDNIINAKWSWNYAKKIDLKIDIHECYEYVFRKSCINGHLNIAMWLWKLADEMESPINLHVICPFDKPKKIIFEKVCDLGENNIAEWLCEICPAYEIENINGNLKYKILSKNEIPNDYRKSEIIFYDNNDIVYI